MKKKIALGLAAIAVAVFGIFAPAAYANDICTGYKGDQTNPNIVSVCDTSKTETDAQNTVKNILNTVFAWVGTIAVIVVIIGGVFYIISQGDPGKVTRAKNAILYALIGLIVTLLSFAIVNFVLDKMA